MADKSLRFCLTDRRAVVYIIIKLRLLEACLVAVKKHVKGIFACSFFITLAARLGVSAFTAKEVLVHIALETLFNLCVQINGCHSQN